MAEEWLEVKDNTKKPIGMLLYVDGKLAGVAAFHDDRDKNKNGDISAGEHIQSYLPIVKMKGSVMMDVMTAAYGDPELLIKDPSLRQMYGKVFTEFAGGMVMEGIYLVYFQRGVSAMSSGVSKMVVSGMVKQFMVRKGMETTVKKAFEAASGL